jgi:glycosyltransferase involved in cell wall biosynthesis
MITDIARYLSSDFEVHIIGFGEESDIACLNEQIENHNKSYSKCARVFYDGKKTGRDYIEYLQSCHIGLCPQIINDKYNDASFPSKISSYLANGLRVVATDTNAIQNSRLSQYICVAPYNAKDIADTIQSINVKTLFPIEEALNKLVSEQLKDLEKLLV